MNIRVEEVDLHYTSRFYGPVSEELHSNEPPVLTPERMAHDWWMCQKLLLNFEGESLMTVYKTAARDEPPSYRLFWPDFLSTGKKGGLMLEKLVPMLGLFSDLSEKGFDVGKVRVSLRHPLLKGLGPTPHSDYAEAFLLDQIVERSNQKLINESSSVQVQSTWLETEIENYPPHYAAVIAYHYFGIDAILKCFANSFYNPTSPALRHLDEVGRRLDDLIEGFPPAPRVQAIQGA